MPLFDRFPTLLVAIVVAITATFHLGFAAIDLPGTAISDLGAKLFGLVLIALAIERAVEIYIANRFGPSRKRMNTNLKIQRRRAATIACMVMSFAVCLVGVRLLAQLVDGPFGSNLQAQSFRVVDVILTSLLLSGGADGLHQIVIKATRHTLPRST